MFCFVLNLSILLATINFVILIFHIRLNIYLHSYFIYILHIPILFLLLLLHLIYSCVQIPHYNNP